MDLFAWVALALLVVGVVGSVVPMLPGALLSVAGVLLYWWSTGFSDPGPFALVGLLGLGVTAMLADYGGGFVAARVGGATTRTSLLAGAVGFVLLFVLGPLGLVVGVAGTVFAVEYLEHEDAEESGRRALYATVGVLASTVVQVVFTLAMLLGLVLVVVI